MSDPTPYVRSILLLPKAGEWEATAFSARFPTITKAHGPTPEGAVSAVLRTLADRIEEDTP